MTLYMHEDAFAGRRSEANYTGKVSYALGAYEDAVRSRLATWVQSGIPRRIWDKDFTVWTPEEVPEITDRLGWLLLPETMRSQVDDIQIFASDVMADAVGYVVLLGMGGSSLAPEVYQKTFGNRPDHPELIVLDSTHPDAVRAIRDKTAGRKTLFLVASKSGTTIESLSLFEYFFQLLHTEKDPGSHFAAITDPGSPLERLAAERGFRKVFRAPADLGGRYSALSHFGMVPAALIGMDIAGYLGRSAQAADRCKVSGAEQINPGLLLGAVLGELALRGRDKITFLTSPSLEAFPQWLEQLIAESTGKDGRGIVPIVGEPRALPETYSADRVFTYITTSEEADAKLDDFLEGLAGTGHPIARFELRELQDLAGEMFRWEMAVASAGAALGVHPFNQPDVEAAKSLAREAMSEDPSGGSAMADAVSVEDPGGLERSIADLLETMKPTDYLGVNAFIRHSAQASEILREIRACLHDRCGTATMLGFGPRYLHSTGQLHKGGPNTGAFIQLVDQPYTDIEVPSRDYTFGSLISAQALGDYRALSSRGRREVRLNLGTDVERGLGLLLTAIASGAGR